MYIHHISRYKSKSRAINVHDMIENSELKHIQYTFMRMSMDRMLSFYYVYKNFELIVRRTHYRTILRRRIIGHAQ